MADQRITQLTALPKAAVAATDVLPISDVSASETKKVTAKDLVAAGIDLVDAGEIDLAKLDQGSATKLATQALADDAVTAAKLANDSSIAVATTAPSADNFEGRGYFDSSSGNLQVHNGSTYQQVVLPTAGIGDAQVTTPKLADGAVTTAKVSPLGSAAYAAGSVNTAALADAGVTTGKIANDAVTADKIAAGAVGTSELASDAVTYEKIQDVSSTDRLLGRSSAGAGDVEEITCTAAGRALLDDADAAAQRDTLGLGSLATASGTWTNGSSFSGTSSGTNTGDQTITLTGDVTGSGTGSFAATIAAGVVNESKLAAASVSTSRLQDDAVTAAKLANNSATIVSTLAPSGQGDFVGQGWLNTSNNLAYRWDGAAWVREAGIGTINVVDSTPLSLAVTYPDSYTATLTTTLDTQAAATVWAGPASGADAAPTFRALAPGDLPDATAITKGIVQPGTGLAVSSGTLNHSNAVTGATVSGITFDNQGHVTAAAPLVAGDIPVLDASKVTSGEFGTSRLQDDAVTAAKLANYSTAQIGEVLPVAAYIGQIFFNPLDKAFFLWDGNVWQPIGISQGAVVFAGTYDAAQNEVLSLTTEGSAIGLTVGQPLPAASQTNLGYYVVVAESGTGTSPAPAVALAPPDLILSNGSSWTEIDVSSTYTSQTASNISFTPAANIGSTSVQGAIEEVSTECRNADNLSSGTVAVARGGTGTGSYTKGDLLAATGATGLGKLAVGTNGQVLTADSAEATGLKWTTLNNGTVTNVTGSGAISVANGTTTPAISVASASTSAAGVVQLSDSTSTTSSTLAATTTAVKAAYDLANAAMPKAGGTFTGDVTLGVNVGLLFEGSSDDANETRLVAANPTADRTITLPDRDGTVILSGDTGTVTSTMIADGAIVNADINASAAIAGTKISPDFGSQNVVTTGTAAIGLSSGSRTLSVGSSTNNEGIEIRNTSTAAALTKASRLQFSGTDTVGTTKEVANIYCTPANNDYTASTLIFYNRESDAVIERGRFTSDGYFKASNDGTYFAAGGAHEFRQTKAADGVYLTCTNGSFASASIVNDVTRSATSAYSFAFLRSNSGSDTEFNLRGDGNGFCDGAWTGGGADYAEYFEWSDGNLDEEDRRGISVVLDGDKIREALLGEDPIGVISVNPSVVGDAAWNKWDGKYLRDEFGSYILEDYEVEDEDGNTVIQQRRKLNPAYDPNAEYIPREQRPEWDCVGLMGKLRVRKGQATGLRWIKMRNVSESVEEWLVR